VLWALADPTPRAGLRTRTKDAAAQCVQLIEAHALFTRVGSGRVGQLPVRGAIAAAIDHWDSRTDDATSREPNLSELLSRR